MPSGDELDVKERGKVLFKAHQPSQASLHLKKEEDRKGKKMQLTRRKIIRMQVGLGCSPVTGWKGYGAPDNNKGSPGPARKNGEQGES